jgi:hypothetical protein
LNRELDLQPQNAPFIALGQDLCYLPENMEALLGTNLNTGNEYVLVA